MASTDLLIIITHFDFAGVPKIIIQVRENDNYPVSETSYMFNMELDLEMMKLVRDDDIEFDFWWLRQYFFW